MSWFLGEAANFCWTHPAIVFLVCVVLGVCKTLDDRRRVKRRD